MNPEFEIESGIPLPAFVPGGKFPLAQLEPGQSFKAPFEMHKSVMSRASSYQQTHPGVQFSVRIREQGGEKFVRVWRVDGTPNAREINQPKRKP